MRISYRVVREKIHTVQNGSFDTYGLEAYDWEKPDHVLVRVSDVSLKQEAVADLARACTRGSLSLIHMRDVIEDRLASV